MTPHLDTAHLNTAHLVTAHLVTWAIVALSILGVIAHPFKWPEAVWAVAGAVLLVVFKLLSPADAWDGVLKGLDVYLFLIGMMALAEVARQEGLFDWLASLAVRGAKGSASKLFLLIYAVGIVVTAFLSNDATAVVLTPAVYAAAKAAKAEPLPYLFICALIANAASFVLPISNPANLVVFASHMPPLGQWLMRFGLASIASIVATFVVLRWSQRKMLADPIEADVERKTLSFSGKIAGAGIVVTGIALIVSSALDLQLGLPTFIAGLLTVAVVLAIKREGPWNTVKDISWAVIPLVAGLFVLVEALEKSGVLTLLGGELKQMAARSDVSAGWISGIVIAVATNLVNNLPAGLLAGAAVQAAHVHDKVAGAILIGVDIGPNLSVTGSLATILWLTAIRREGEDVSAWAFLKLGMIAMPPALLAALAGLYILPDPSFAKEPRMNPVLLYPFILFAGVLQAAGNSMNARLRLALVNPWLAASISFSLIVFVFVTIFVILPVPLPTLESLGDMPWWAPLGGIAGAVAVFGGLAFVDKVGAGPFNGLLITANILTSLAIDNFGWLHMHAQTQSLPHLIGGALMVGGIVLIAKF